MNEFHIYGPPGTGKTRRAAHDIERAVEKHGADRVMACSFTKAAAQEIGERSVKLAPGMCGTLHAICYHALDRPVIAETKIEEFNDAHPVYALSDKGGASVDEGLEAPAFEKHGDQLQAAYTLHRARRVDRALWNTGTLAFAKAWEDWKEQSDYYDFTDMLESALRNFRTAPGHPKVIFVDEAQDLSALQYALVRQWAERAEFVVFLGDDDQSIYRFSGADPENMIGANVPPENKIVLAQSYRLPLAVHDLAQRWIRQCTRRQEKDFQARKHMGEVLRSSATCREPERIVAAVEEDMAKGRRSMVLASCSYMLQDTITCLREHGIPFHNPYRRTRGDWNPLHNSAGSTMSRIKAFLGVDDRMFPIWTAKQMELWTALVRSDGLLKRGAKKAIADLAEIEPERRLEQPEWLQWFEGDPFGFEPIGLKWLLNHANEKKRKGLQYPARVIERQGLDAKTSVTVGTVHSVKGGEAKSVYLFPDLSQSAWREWERGAEWRDNVRRVFYVGMTRARERLTIAEPSGGLYVNVN